MARTSNRSARGNPIVALLWNSLTLMTLLAIVCVGGYYTMIFLNPQSGFNPFPPRTPEPIEVISLPSPTVTTINQLPPTWTPTLTSEPTATWTPRPTDTPGPTNTLVILPTRTNTPTPTNTPVPSFILVNGAPVYTTAGSVVSGRTCAWFGIGGTVLDATGAAANGLRVVLSGELEGGEINRSVNTGTVEVYGPGGFEFYLADDPLASSGMYVQLIGPDGKTYSPRINLPTYDDCARNLVRLDFVQQQP